MPSQFAKDLADIALGQHSQYHLLHESSSKLCTQIQAYWQGISPGFSSCTAVPWSAVFISWCVKQAGATSSDFAFAAAHSVFVHDAINNPRAFEGLPLNKHAPQIGDIIQNNRGGSTHDFAFAKANKSYKSHSAIVVEVGDDTDGRYALTVGGNESDSVRRTRVDLDNNGFLSGLPYICVLKNNK
jgi:hypothetical protein